MSFDPNCFKIVTPETKGFVRIGGPHDGGYVMVDDFDGLDHVVSIGVGSDASFDLAMAERGAFVTLVDGSVVKPPASHKNFELIRYHWDEIGLRLHMVSTKSGETILKFDVEGAEWDCLPLVSTMTLVRFRQIVCELHDLDTRFDSDAFARLTTFHELVHIHPNNFGGTFEHEGKTWPKVIECTLLRRDRDKFKPHDMVLPIPADSPNSPGVPDLTFPLEKR